MSLLKQEPGGGLLGKWVGRTKCLQISLCVCHKACLSLANRVKEAQPSGSPFNCDTQLRPNCSEVPSRHVAGRHPRLLGALPLFLQPSPRPPTKIFLWSAEQPKSSFQVHPLFGASAAGWDNYFGVFTVHLAAGKRRDEGQGCRVQSCHKEPYESRRSSRSSRRQVTNQSQRFPKPAAVTVNLCRNKPMRRRIQRRRKKWLVQKTQDDWNKSVSPFIRFRWSCVAVRSLRVKQLEYTLRSTPAV